MSRKLAAIAAVALMAGCSMPNGSIAARVGEEDIKDSHVAAVAQGCSAIVRATPNELQRDVVKILVRGELAQQLGKAHSLDMSQGRLDALLREAAPNILALKADPLCGELATAMAKFSLVLTTMGQDPLVAEGLKVDVDVNPRYGQWDPTMWELAGTGSMSVPASGLR